MTRDRSPRVLQRRGPSGGPQEGPITGKDVRDPRANRLRRSLDELAVVTVDDEVRHRADGGGDNGKAGGQCFQDDQGVGLIGAGQDEHIGTVQDPPWVRHRAKQVQPFTKRPARRVACDVCDQVRGAADDHEMRRLGQGRDGFNELWQALATELMAHEEHHLLVRANTKLRPGGIPLRVGGGTEPLGIDAVADDDASGPHPPVRATQRVGVGRRQTDHGPVDPSGAIPHGVASDGEGVQGVSQDPPERTAPSTHGLDEHAVVDVDVPHERIVVADHQRPRVAAHDPPRQHRPHRREPGDPGPERRLPSQARTGGRQPRAVRLRKGEPRRRYAGRTPFGLQVMGHSAHARARPNLWGDLEDVDHRFATASVRRRSSR